MPVAITSIPASKYRDHYDPTKVLKHPEFQTLAEDAPELSDPNLNIACAYNPAHEVHMIKKPRFDPGPGEVTIHVRATGICGYVFPVYHTKTEFKRLMFDVVLTFTSGSMATLALL